MTNGPTFVKKAGVTRTGLRDHSLIYAILNTKTLHPKTETVIKRLFKHFNQEQFLDDFSARVVFSTAYVFDNVECGRCTQVLGKDVSKATYSTNMRQLFPLINGIPRDLNSHLLRSET